MVINDTLCLPFNDIQWSTTRWCNCPPFLIYINDTNSNIDIKSDMSLFADDTKNFRESDIFLQSILNNIYKWPKTRKLDLNPNKCKILTIKKRQTI